MLSHGLSHLNCRQGDECMDPSTHSHAKTLVHRVGGISISHLSDPFIFPYSPKSKTIAVIHLALVRPVPSTSFIIFVHVTKGPLHA